MKTQILLFLLGCFTIYSTQSYSQSTTVTIDLSSSVTGMERSGAPTLPVSAVPDFSAYSWTCGGAPCIGRTLMSIDLSAIPSNATILSAHLSLYADPMSALGYFGQPTYGTQNRGVIKRITSPWDPNTVTWNNQPTLSDDHKLLLKSSSTVTDDYINLDATALIQDMIDNPSYGILLKMSDETNHYKSLIFGSNLNSVNQYKPSLVVTYLVDGVQKSSTPLTSTFEVGVSPNPASNDLQFNFSEVNGGDIIQLSVFNLTGQLLHTEKMTTTSAYSMNISDLEQGVYFYKAENQTSGATCSGKIVKQ